MLTKGNRICGTGYTDDKRHEEWIKGGERGNSMTSNNRVPTTSDLKRHQDRHQDKIALQNLKHLKPWKSYHRDFLPGLLIFPAILSFAGVTH